jgi:hypothetical protein
MKLKILYLFPHHLNIYGDRGNILTLLHRTKKRGIDTEVVEINSHHDKIPSDINLIFGGGGQDKQQEYVSGELQFFKDELHELIFGKKVPALTICGTYQLFGHYFRTHTGTKIKGISVFDAITVASKVRKIGNVVIRVAPSFNLKNQRYSDLLIGFENHSGNTFVGWGNYQKELEKISRMSEVDRAYGVQVPSIIEQNISVLGDVVRGFGNNGIDGHEGAIVENCIGTYLHGPLLPKNPQLADWLISKALKIDKLQKIDDKLEEKARGFILNRLVVSAV